MTPPRRVDGASPPAERPVDDAAAASGQDAAGARTGSATGSSSLTPRVPGLEELLAAADGQYVAAAAGAGSSDPAATGERLDELADDMLALMRRLRSLEEGQQHLAERLEQLVEQQFQGGHSFAREVDTLRREVLRDRRHTATADVIAELMPLVEKMKTMHVQLDAERDERMRSQLLGVVEALEGCQRRLGGEPFGIEAGAAFDGFQMTVREPCDLAGMVVATTIEPGMRCGQLILRRAVVQLMPGVVTPVDGGSVNE